MTFKTDALRTIIQNEGGIASNNRYMVFLPTLNGTPKPDGTTAKDPVNVADLNQLCTAARIPGKNLNTVERQIGLEQLKVANGYTFGEVSLTFYLTNSYGARKYFQEWSECIATPNPPYNMGFHNNYSKSIFIEQQNRSGDLVYRAELVKAFPTTFTEIELNNQAQTAALEFTVSLTFSNYLIR